MKTIRVLLISGLFSTLGLNAFGQDPQPSTTVEAVIQSAQLPIDVEFQLSPELRADIHKLVGQPFDANVIWSECPVWR